MTSKKLSVGLKKMLETITRYYSEECGKNDIIKIIVFKLPIGSLGRKEA
jgi:hypothetical protein